MNSMITTISSKNITAVIAAIILCLSIVLTACAPTELPNDSELPSVSDAQGTCSQHPCLTIGSHSSIVQSRCAIQ